MAADRAESSQWQLLHREVSGDIKRFGRFTVIVFVTGAGAGVILASLVGVVTTAVTTLL